MGNVSPTDAGVTVSDVFDAVRAVAALDDPHRARLYRAVRDAGTPVTREDAAREVGISRKLAAFHLDRLVDAGLLEASYDRPAGVAARVGRAPKRYRASDVEVEVSVPERHYDIVGEILVDALSEAHSGTAATDAVDRIAYERGHQLGADARTTRRLGRLGPERATTVLVELLATLGFEPASADGRVVQRNCPFRRLAQRSPTLVCGINRCLVQGMLDGLGASRLAAALSPADDRCCVVVTAS
jgi:predicted ArsR family transcriptional regulator